MAIDELLDEHEQSERVRTWLRDNAAGLIGGVALGLSAIYGWIWWQGRGEAARFKASDEYQVVTTHIQSGKLKEAQSAAAAIKDSQYTILAGLDIAKAQLDAKQRDAAIATLRGLKVEGSVLAPIVHQRLARLLIDAGKHDDALKLLEGADDTVTLEVRGDALYAAGRKDQAREAYAKALRQLDEAAPQRNLIELKLTQAGGKPSKPGAKS